MYKARIAAFVYSELSKKCNRIPFFARRPWSLTKLQALFGELRYCECEFLSHEVIFAQLEPVHTVPATAAGWACAVVRVHPVSDIFHKAQLS